MHEYIARLIRCGVPRKVAACVCMYFHRRGKQDDLARYVEEVEKENGKVADVE